MMVELETYRATDRRVYWGAPCSDMKREFDRTDNLWKRMKAADPTARCVYFPMEGKYLVHHYPNNPHRPEDVTGVMHEDNQVALIEAIKVLESRKAALDGSL